MPLRADLLINERLMEHVTNYLQTLDPAWFPFTAKFDDERRTAFVRDLRMGLSDYTEGGSKRGTSSVGYIISDKRLRQIVEDWADADGGWPKGQNPTNAFGVTGVVSFDVADGAVRTPAPTAPVTTAPEETPRPAPARSKKLPTDGEGTSWVVGDGTYNTPTEYPIKGNANSHIYHPEASPSYAITIAEICFRDAETAESFGYRLPKNMGAAAVTFGKDLADAAGDAIDGK